MKSQSDFHFENGCCQSVNSCRKACERYPFFFFFFLDVFIATISFYNALNVARNKVPGFIGIFGQHGSQTGNMNIWYSVSKANKYVQMRYNVSHM